MVIVVEDEETVAGRRFDDARTAELKRVWTVLHRRRAVDCPVGRRAIGGEDRAQGYLRICLRTTPTRAEAIALYPVAG